MWSTWRSKLSLVNKYPNTYDDIGNDNMIIWNSDPTLLFSVKKKHQLHVRCRFVCFWPERKYRVMVMVNGKWWPQKVILVPLASPSGGRRKDWRAQWRQWYISFLLFFFLVSLLFARFLNWEHRRGSKTFSLFIFLFFCVLNWKHNAGSGIFFPVFSCLFCT